MGEESRAFEVMGMTMLVRLSAEESGGAMSIIEQTVPPGKGSPLHLIREDKTFYVLEGEFTIRRGDESLLTRVGEAVFIPRHTLHNFTNTGNTYGRLIVVVSPAGHERFLRDLSEAGPQLRDNRQLFTEISARHGVRLG